MKLFSNKISAGLFFTVVFLGLSAYGYLWLRYAPYSGKRGAELGAVKSCEEMYTEKLHGFTATFEGVTPHYLPGSDYNFAVTGEVIYVDKAGKVKKEKLIASSTYPSL